ncbi:MAG: cobalt transporter [Lachnospiraceae bacterium]|nr:cobalt transporter [Lachnospiraceae bacterium]
MHMVDGEHGHSHGHGCSGCAGEHSHEHTHTHTHPHVHEGDHTHDHDQDHAHDHSHAQEHGHSHGAQGCSGCEGGCQRPANEQEAILAYMLDHNKHHAAELLEIAKQFHKAGRDEAAVQIEKAVEDFEKGNMRLSIALSLVKTDSQ